MRKGPLDRFYHSVRLPERSRYLPLVGIGAGCISGLVFLIANQLFASKGLAILLSMAATLATMGIMYENPLALFIKFQLLLLMPEGSIPVVLIASHAFSRFAAGSFMFTNESSPHDSQPAMHTADFVIMAFIGMVPLLAVGSLTFLLLLPLLWIVRSFFGMWCIRENKGYTTECLISIQRMVELCFYLLVLIAFAHPITIN